MTQAVTDLSVLMESTVAAITENEPTTYDYASTTTMDGLWTYENGSNSTNEEDLLRDYAVFGTFNIFEIIMTSVELMVWIIAAIKMPRWRKNYRNQMLMQISVARFIKRVIFSFKFLHDNGQLTVTKNFAAVLDSSQIYIDFVIVILVFFFIKHMYDSLIIVLVKIRQNHLYKVALCAWLVPLPMSAVWSAIIVCDVLDKTVVYLLICCIFRWPLIFMGTAVYVTTLYKVMSDKIRSFARSLTVVTFFMCLVINFYLLSKDVIELWCNHSFETKLISYTSGIIMNFLILSFYIILITLDYKHCIQTPKTIDAIPNYSLADTCCKISSLNDNYS